MRASNKLAVNHLLENGFNDVWLKPHTARNDMVYCQDRKYLATDLWNLFDGITFIHHKPHFIQIKTNAWAAEKPIKEFLKTHYIDVIVINVTNRLKVCKGKYKVFAREYK
jgi:hypothetical protein